MHTSRCRKQPEYDQLQIPFVGQAHPPRQQSRAPPPPPRQQSRAPPPPVNNRDFKLLFSLSYFVHHSVGVEFDANCNAINLLLVT